MDKLISVSHFKKSLSHVSVSGQNRTAVTAVVQTLEKVVTQLLENEPSVDAVEVVRCKDCARASEKDGIFMCGYFGCWMDPYEFCSQGERKE